MNGHKSGRRTGDVLVSRKLVTRDDGGADGDGGCEAFLHPRFASYAFVFGGFFFGVCVRRV